MKTSTDNLKSNKQVIVDFIVSCLEKGERRNVILAKVGKKWQNTPVSPRTFDRLLKIANTQHQEKQQHIKVELAKVDAYAAVEARKKAIMSTEERKEYLTKLIYGEIEVPYKEVKWNPVTKAFETIEFVELAGHTARINAIAELNKMEGDYAPNKIAQTDTAGHDIEPQKPYTKEQLLDILKEANA